MMYFRNWIRKEAKRTVEGTPMEVRGSLFLPRIFEVIDLEGPIFPSLESSATARFIN